MDWKVSVTPSHQKMREGGRITLSIHKEAALIPVPVRLRLKIITCNFQRSFLSCKGIILMSAQPLMVQVMAAYVSLRLRMNFPHLFIVLTGKDKAVRVAPHSVFFLRLITSPPWSGHNRSRKETHNVWAVLGIKRSGERFLTGFLLQLKHVSLWPPFHHEGHTLKRKREL